MESPQRDPTTPGVARMRLPVCAYPPVRMRPPDSDMYPPVRIRSPAWADRKTGRTARHTEQDRQHAGSSSLTLPYAACLKRLPRLPALPVCPDCLSPPARFPPCPYVSYCQRERHTRIPQNGLLSSPFTIFQFVKTLHTDTQPLIVTLNIMFII